MALVEVVALVPRAVMAPALLVVLVAWVCSLLSLELEHFVQVVVAAPRTTEEHTALAEMEVAEQVQMEQPRLGLQTLAVAVAVQNVLALVFLALVVQVL